MDDTSSIPVSPAKAAPTEPAPGPRPLWVPPDLRYHTLPLALQQAITEIIDPAYRELVLEAQTGLERSVGLTYVHLAWLEMIEAMDIGKDMAQTLPKGEGTHAHQLKIRRYLRLIAQKDKIARFILEVEKFYARAAEVDPLTHRSPSER